MTDMDFEMFLEKSIKNFGEDYFDYSEENVMEYTFSKKFERKMARLIRQQKSFYYPLIKTPVRRIITTIIAAIAIMSTMVISVSALRNAFVHFLTELFDTHTQVQTVPDYNKLENFEDIYIITNLPEGFEITFQNDSSQDISALITEYRNGAERIIFSQYIESQYNVNVNTEGYDMIPLDVNGNEGFMISMGDDIYIAWDNGDYIFEIVGNIGENQLIDIANSVQKIE